MAMVTVDGETYFSQSYTLSGSNFNFNFNEAQGICGNQMIIRIRGGTQSAEESIFIDRVLVTGDRGRRPAAPQPRDYCEGEDGLLQILNVSSNAEIVWFAPNGDDITPIGNKEKLQIKNLRVEDSGLYSAFIVDPDQGCVTPILLDYELFVFPTFPERVSLTVPETPICEGEDVKLKASPIGSNYEYTWIGPDNQEIVACRNSDTCLVEEITVEDAGGYLVLVSNLDFGACGIGEAENTLLVNQGPGQVTINVSDYCVGSEATIEVTTQNPGNYIYTWILPDGNRLTTTQTKGTLTIDNIQFRDEGRYILLVSNADGSCERMIGNGINVMVSDGIDKPTITTADNICVGFPSLTTDAQGNGTIYWYDDDDNLVAQNEATYQPERPGKYYAIVIDPNGGCQSPPSDPFDVVETDVVEAEVQASENQICSDAQTTLVASGGTQFSWSTGATSSNITVGPGTYEVTVSNTMGCEDQASFTIEYFPDFEAKITGINPICFGTTTDLSVGVGEDFEWSNGSKSNQINVSAGTYEVTVTDENGCQTSSTFTLEYFENFEVEITGESQICEGGESTLTTNTGESYRWNTGATTQSISATAGHYRVTVTDENTCQAEASFTVEQLPDFQAHIEGETQICEGEQTTLTATTGTNYLWSNGSTAKSIEVGAGDYMITVTNLGGCEANTSIQVFSSAPPSFSISSAASCSPSLENYQITISTLSTNQFSTTNGNILNNSNGNYTIELPSGQDLQFEIENSVGCSISEIIVAPDCSCPNIAPPQKDGDVEICEGETFPTLSVDVGETNLMANWYDAFNGGNLVQRNSSTFKPEQAGTYYVEVVDETNNCHSTRTPIALIINDLPQLASLITDHIDCNNTTGSITAVGAGGNEPYEYALNNGNFSVNNDFDGLTVGNYRIAIRNAKGCVNDFFTQINVNQRTDEETITQYNCEVAELGSETIRLTNSLGCDSLITIITLDGSSTPTLLFETTCDPSQAAVETITLTNQYGCDSLVITEYTLIESDTTFIGLTSCNPEDVGEQMLSLENQFGCDSIVIVTVEYAEKNMLFLEATSCEPEEVGIDTSYYTNQFGCDSIVVVETKLQGTGHSDLTFFRKMTCDFGRLGLDTTHYQNQHGCYSIVIIERYFGFPPPPQLNITRDQRICRGDTIFLTSDSYDYNLQWLKDTEEIDNATDNSLYITESGGYAISYFNDEGCVVISDVVEIMVIDTPAEPIFSNTNNLLQLAIEADSQMVSYQWYLNDEPIEGAITDVHCAKTSGVYTLIATNDATGCSSSFTMDIIHDPDVEACLVSIEEIFERIDFKVYPNPHVEQFRIEYYLDHASTVEIKIFDVVGKVHYRQREKVAATKFSHSIATKYWTEGIYLLQINVDGVNYIRKVVKGK